MSITAPTPDPVPEDISRGLAAIEHHLTQAAADLPAPMRPLQAGGETRRVRQLRAEVAEAHLLAELQGDDVPLLVDTAKVRKRRKAAQQAARLHALAQDPAMRAWQAARVRKVLVAVGLVALSLALAWSTAGVQAFAAGTAPAWSPGWVFAWLVEPFMSLALLMVVGARAYLATQGQPSTSRALVRIEWLFLALTLGMNAWPYLLGIAQTFNLSRLVLHLLGPIVAVAVVTALPIILAAFTRLDHGRIGEGGGKGVTGPKYRPNTGAERSDDQPHLRPGDAALTVHVRRLIAAGELPAYPSAAAIRRALRCGTDTARTVRDALIQGA